jgi:Arc/MetJ-type ribon-helix-helix transcriptional regulator
MPAAEKRTVSLPSAQADYIDSLVETGTYASANEVVRAGLRALQERMWRSSAGYATRSRQPTTRCRPIRGVVSRPIRSRQRSLRTTPPA